MLRARRHVTVAAPTAFKLELATTLGADRTYLMDRGDLAGDVRALRDLSGGSGYDVVVDATGAAAVAEVLLPLTRNGGTAVFYGVTDEEDRVAVSPYDVFRSELTIKGSFAEISSFPAALAALRAGRARTDGMITHRFPLDRLRRGPRGAALRPRPPTRSSSSREAGTTGAPRRIPVGQT